jgi:hypothetical protein
LEAGFAMQHLPGGDSVHDEGLYLSRVEVVGDRYQVPGVDEGVGGPAAGLGDRGDSLADEPVIGPWTDLADSADQVVAEDERELRLAGVAPSEHGLFSEGDAGGEDLDERLSGSRRWNGAVVDEEPVRLGDPGHDDLGEDRVRVGRSAGCRFHESSLSMSRRTGGGDLDRRRFRPPRGAQGSRA